MRIAFTHNLQTSSDEAQAEFDREETVVAIAQAIERLGHKVTRVDVGGSAAALVRTLESLKPDLVFNTAEGTHGRFREAFYPGLFEQLGLAYTGSDAWVCALTLDKQLTKMMVAQAGVPTPKWVFVDHSTGTVPLDHVELRFPVIVKPNFEGSSKGITQDSIVEHAHELRPKVAALLDRYPSGLLVEEFIVGRDVVVPFLEAAAEKTHGVLTPVSYKFDERIIGKRKYAIYDYDLKCVSYDAVEVECPAPLPKAQREELLRLSHLAFKALGIRDLGRIDWRITEDGRVYFLEINALPSLEPGAGIYLSAALAGLERVEDVLEAVIHSAARRQGVSLSSGPFARKRKLRCGFVFNVKRRAAKHAHDDDSEAEYDSEQTIDQIAAAIAAQDVEVVRLEANDDLPRRLSDAQLDLAFNLGEGMHGRGRECHAPALLEMLQIPFTGSDSVTMALALDKALAKSVVRDAGVPTPRHTLMRTGEEPIKGLSFPLVVKPNAEGSSKGVHPRSVVEDEPTLRQTVRDLVKRYGQDILVEEFLPGREFTVGLVGDQMRPRVLPPMEIVFVKPDSRHPIYAFGDKLDWTKKIRYDRPAKLTPALAREVEQAALGVWRALGCRDVARVDLRQDARGRVSFIECNPLPGLTPGWSDLCLIAEGAGLPYQALIGEIMKPVFERLDEKRAR